MLPNATKAQEHANAAKASAEAAKTAAKTAVDNPVKDNNKSEESVSPPTTEKTTVQPTTLQPVVAELSEVAEESNPEIMVTVKTTPKENNSGSDLGIGSQNDPKEKDKSSGNALTMSTIGFISCLIFYSLINQLEVPASLF